jgi:glycosyltransferase involved in cell wall biosynthesis
MGRIEELQDNLRYLWHEEGAFAVADRVATHAGNVLGRIIPEHALAREDNFVDVLLINGCAPEVPHPTRYRVMHQAEQLESVGVSTAIINAWEITDDMARTARAFIIFRCPYTDEIGSFIRLAKAMNKPVLYDIDDLVFDTEYTDQTPYVQGLDADGKAIYDDGVIRMGKTLDLCDGAITSTPQLAQELERRVQPVFVNRNVASNEMVFHSDKAVYERDVLSRLPEDHVRLTEHRRWEVACERYGQHDTFDIGYFSGSITHNSDFEQIIPALVRFIDAYPDVRLHVVGELALPLELRPYESRVVRFPFLPWQRLPRMIAGVDVNLIPLEDTIFNRAKSENKWVEAALVKVPSIASDVGALHDSIADGVDGILCATEEEWYDALVRLHDDRAFGKALGEAAHDTCLESHTTDATGMRLAEFLLSQMAPSIGFVLPGVKTSGGVLVAATHAAIMQEAGWDVTLLDNSDEDSRFLSSRGRTLPVVHSNELLRGRFDKLVATMWSTVDFMRRYQAAGERFYLVQNYEPEFYDRMDASNLMAKATYGWNPGITFCTISPWCCKWLEERYGHKVRYAPNGIDVDAFAPVERDWSGKIRILIEGDSQSAYKNVAESFKIVSKLDPERYEVWYMSYNGEPQPGWRYDRFLHEVPHDQVADVYRSCHILLKTSVLESFSYPPLEMIATGGAAVVLANEGNAAYLVDGKNCLLFAQGEDDKAAELIEQLADDGELREHLREGGLATAKRLDWVTMTDQIISLYA